MYVLDLLVVLWLQKHLADLDHPGEIEVNGKYVCIYKCKYIV